MRLSPPSVALALAGLLLSLAACDIPRFQGPQVQSPPEGFVLRPQTTLDVQLFPERTITYQDTWIRDSFGEFSGIYINGYPGSSTFEEVEEARRHALTVRGNRTDQVQEFSDVERLRIDGREAFAWSELVRSEARGIEYVGYRAVVPYDTITYTVEFISGDPTFKIRVDSLRTIAASFAVGRTRLNIPLFLLMAGVLVFLAARLRARSQDRKLRHASMTLPKIERASGEEGSREGTGGTATPSAGAKPGDGGTAGGGRRAGGPTSSGGGSGGGAGPRGGPNPTPSSPGPPSAPGTRPPDRPPSDPS